MRPYELTTIYPVEDELYKSVKESIAAIIVKNGGEIAKEEEIGERQLAYEIKGKVRGRYVLYNVNLPEANVAPVEKLFKLENNLLKYLFVRACN